MRRICTVVVIVACAAAWAFADPKGGVRSWRELDGELRAANRRVELFVMAPDVPLIGWTETTPTLY